MLILLGVGALCVLGLYSARERMATAAMPLLSALSESVAAGFQIKSMDIVQNGASRSLRIHANLSHPIELGGKTLYPFGSHGMPDAEIQVRIAVGGIFAYPAVLWAIALAWPAKGLRELGARLVAALTLTTLLLCLDLPFTIAAELWNALYQYFEPRQSFPLMVWSRFMMGGGGFMLAATFAAIAIVVGQTIAIHGARPFMQRRPNRQFDATNA